VYVFIYLYALQVLYYYVITLLRYYIITILHVTGVTSDGFNIYGFDDIGYNRDRCNYHAGGPYSPSISVKAWKKLTQQTRRFLLKLPRLCRPLTPLPETWKQHQWLTDPRNVSGW